MKIYRFKNRMMAQVTYEELAEYALRGKEKGSLKDFLKCDLVFEAKNSQEALEAFNNYLESN